MFESHYLMRYIIKGIQNVLFVFESIMKCIACKTMCDLHSSKNTSFPTSSFIYIAECILEENIQEQVTPQQIQIAS